MRSWSLSRAGADVVLRLQREGHRQRAELELVGELRGALSAVKLPVMLGLAVGDRRRWSAGRR